MLPQNMLAAARPPRAGNGSQGPCLRALPRFGGRQCRFLVRHSRRAAPASRQSAELARDGLALRFFLPAFLCPRFFFLWARGALDAAFPARLARCARPRFFFLWACGFGAVFSFRFLGFETLGT